MSSSAFALTLSLLFLPHSQCAIDAFFISAHESILQCLLCHSVPRSILFFPQSENFTVAFLSRFQNARVIFDVHSPKPLLIVAPTHESHARATVLCSRQLHLQLRTRSGGHDYEGLSYSSTFGPFLLLDLVNLRSISFDLYEGQETAWVQSGASLGELYSAIASKSKTLAFPAGFYRTIGVGGHIAGGGIGTIMRAYGVAADNVLDVRIINADGQLLEKESMGKDLFWALRGGGGASFGVILAYKIKLVQVPPKVTVFFKTFVLSQGATAALAQWQQVAYRTDDRLYISATMTISSKTIQVIFSSLFLGEMTELLPIMEDTLAELQVSANDCKELSWIESIASFSSTTPPNSNGPAASNLSFKVKSDIVTEPITEKSWEKICKYIIDGGEQPLLLIEPLGGKLAEIAESETPFPHRNGSKFVMQYILRWPEAGEEVGKKHIDWLREFYEFMAPLVSSNPRAAYLNFRDLDLGKSVEGILSYDMAKVWGRKYYKNNFERLAIAKTAADPDNFFINEQSIPPLF